MNKYIDHSVRKQHVNYLSFSIKRNTSTNQNYYYSNTKMSVESIIKSYFTDYLIIEQESVDYIKERLRLITAIDDDNKLDYLISFFFSDVFKDFHCKICENCLACFDLDSHHTCLDKYTISETFAETLSSSFEDGQLKYTMYYILCKFFNLKPMIKDNACQETYFYFCEVFGVTP